jgi:hypothetical protein
MFYKRKLVRRPIEPFYNTIHENLTLLDINIMDWGIIYIKQSVVGSNPHSCSQK